MVAWGPLIVIHLTNVNPTCKAKMTKLPFVKKGERDNGLLDLIHMDVYGLMSIYAKDGFIYFITFINDRSQYGYLCPIRYEFEVF